MPTIRLRVVCGRGLTMASFSPTIRLSSVDLPTLGRPKMATVPATVLPAVVLPAPVSVTGGVSSLSSEPGSDMMRRGSHIRTDGRAPALARASAHEDQHLRGAADRIGGPELELVAAHAVLVRGGVPAGGHDDAAVCDAVRAHLGDGVRPQRLPASADRLARAADRGDAGGAVARGGAQLGLDGGAPRRGGVAGERDGGHH